MKKKFTQKMALNKKTISNLTHEDMKSIKGASVVWVCSESCSVVFICCDPKTNPLEEKLAVAKEQG